MTTHMQPGLDDRVTHNGLPVTERRHRQGWFRITRADGPAGVILTTRIPGYTEETSQHPTQAAAERAADRIYAQYRADIAAWKRQISDQSEDQED